MQAELREPTEVLRTRESCLYHYVLGIRKVKANNNLINEMWKRSGPDDKSIKVSLLGHRVSQRRTSRIQTGRKENAESAAAHHMKLLMFCVGLHFKFFLI